MSQLRIAFAGASGTGKSTILERIRPIVDLPVVSTSARTLAKEMGFDSPYMVDAVGRRAEFQQTLLERKIAEELAMDEFITDRCSVDLLTYYAMHDAPNIQRSSFEKAYAAFARYTHVFMLPIGAHQDLGSDPARLHSSMYHHIYQELCFGWIRKRIHQFQGQIHTLAMSDLEGRVDYVRAALRL